MRKMHKFQLKTEDLEQYFLEVMNGRRQRWFDRALLTLLFFLSRFFSNIAKFRLWLYNSRSRWLTIDGRTTS